MQALLREKPKPVENVNKKGHEKETETSKCPWLQRQVLQTIDMVSRCMPKEAKMFLKEHTDSYRVEPRKPGLLLVLVFISSLPKQTGFELVSNRPVESSSV